MMERNVIDVAMAENLVDLVAAHRAVKYARCQKQVKKCKQQLRYTQFIARLLPRLRDAVVTAEELDDLVTNAIANPDFGDRLLVHIAYHRAQTSAKAVLNMYMQRNCPKIKNPAIAGDIYDTVTASATTSWERWIDELIAQDSNPKIPHGATAVPATVQRAFDSATQYLSLVQQANDPMDPLAVLQLTRSQEKAKTAIEKALRLVVKCHFSEDDSASIRLRCAISLSNKADRQRLLQRLNNVLAEHLPTGANND